MGQHLIDELKNTAKLTKKNECVESSRIVEFAGGGIQQDRCVRSSTFEHSSKSEPAAIMMLLSGGRR